jgi:hypothetical protein
MTRVNLLLVKPATSWSRIAHKARKDARKHGSTWEAYEAMRAEQRADGLARGIAMCDVPWCPDCASHSWERTSKEVKAMSVKVKRAVISPLPVAFRCEKHVPWFASEWASRYQPLAGETRLSAAA